MAKKKHITPIILDDPQKVAFHTQALKMELAATGVPLATDDEVNQAIATVTKQPLPATKPKKSVKVTAEKPTPTLPAPIEKRADSPRNLKKRETSKGTQAYSVMIDKNIAVEVKMKAFQSGTTFSDVVNNALSQYLLNA
jgi:hypothetical protein